FRGGQRRRGPGQRGGGQEALQAVETRIDIVARRPADRDFAGQQSREFECGAALGVAAVGIAGKAAAVEREVVDAAVALDLDERLYRRRQFVAAAANAAELD